MTSVDESIDVDWVDAPPPRRAGLTGRPSVVLTDVLAALVDNPKRWAAIERFGDPKKGAGAVSRWKHRTKAPVNAGHRWEFVGREGVVYARYLGEAE